MDRYLRRVLPPRAAAMHGSTAAMAQLFVFPLQLLFQDTYTKTT
jgi:hypothetical protein